MTPAAPAATDTVLRMVAYVTAHPGCTTPNVAAFLAVSERHAGRLLSAQDAELWCEWEWYIGSDGRRRFRYRWHPRNGRRTILDPGPGPRKDGNGLPSSVQSDEGTGQAEWDRRR